MKQILNYRSVINVITLNIILLILSSIFAYYSMQNYQSLKSSSRALTLLSTDKEKYTNSILFLKQTLDEILSNNSSTVVSNQTFDIIGKYDDATMIVECVIELKAKYIELLKLIKDLSDTNTIGRIAELKLERDENDEKLKVSIRTHNLLSKKNE